MIARITVGAVMLLASCGAAESAPASEADTIASSARSDECAHVIDATASSTDGTTFSFTATVASADTGWDKYADAWQIRTADGSVLGERVLLHPHETEQPFTRTLNGVEIPMSVDLVVLAAHDSVAGWCGAEFELPLVR